MSSNNHPIYPPTSKPVIRKSVHLVHKNGKHRIVRLGFCWVGFFLPPLWTISEGLWRSFAWSIAGIGAMKIAEAVLSYCDMTGYSAAIPYAGLLRLVGSLGYFFGMAYFGFRGQDLLVEDLLAHGYAEEGQRPKPEMEE